MKKLSIIGLKKMTWDKKTKDLQYHFLQGDGNSIVFYNAGVNSMKFFGYYIIVPIEDFNKKQHTDVANKKYLAHHYCPYHHTMVPEIDFYASSSQNCTLVLIMNNIFQKENVTYYQPGLNHNTEIIKGDVCFSENKLKIVIPRRLRYTLKELEEMPDQEVNPLGKMKKMSNSDNNGRTGRIWISSDKKKVFFEYFHDDEIKRWVVEDEYNL